MKNCIDEKIPYTPQFIVIYILWYPMIAFFPVLLYYCSASGYAVYMVAITTDILISLAVYLVYPSSFERPAPPDGFWGWIMRIVYRCDYKGKNCMPSMHCSMCFIIIAFSVSVKGIPLWMRMVFSIISVLIVFSTVFTKQHVIIDVITAALLAAVCCFAGGIADPESVLMILGLR